MKISQRRYPLSGMAVVSVDCLNCGGMLLEQEMLDDQGHWDVPPDKTLDLNLENKSFFFTCPHCNAKNFITPTTNQYGVPQIKITRYSAA